MQSRMDVWSSACALVIALAVPSLAQADRDIDDVKEPDKATPLAAWTPAQQWWPNRANVSTHGYGSNSGMLVLADELGDKFSQLGRASLVDRCFEYAKEDTTAAFLWAMCGHDARALDLKKLEAELVADDISPASRTSVLDRAREIHAKAKKIGDAVEAGAKTDPGVAALLKIGDAARAEWAAYLGKNKPAFERYLSLKDAVRSGKSNHANFKGCWEATQPAFVKLVKAAKFNVELSRDYVQGYMAPLVRTPEGYITTAAYAACAYSVHEGGEALIAGAANQETGGIIKVGWRTLALAKALDQSFNPKFAERSLKLDEMRSSWRRDRVTLEGINENAHIMTASEGTVATIKPDGDTAKITFKKDTVDACLEWRDTTKIAQISPNGSITYEKVCKRRGKRINETTATEVGTKFAGGITPGANVIVVSKFPVAVTKGAKLVAVLGVPL